MALDLFAQPVAKKPPRLPAQKAPPLPPESPPEEHDPESPSVLRRVGSVAGGGLSAVGNLLDVPGSVVRSALRLHNPLDTILHPLSDVNRTSGRDLLRSYGMAGKEDTWGNFGAGLAADIALDPLTYFTGGASAAGKTGKLLKAAGVVDDAARIAAAKAGKAVSAIGKNEARLTTTAADFLKHGAPEVVEKVKKLNLTPDQLNEPIGSLFRFAGHAVGTGPTAAKVARGIDTAKSAVKFAKIPGTDFAPINELHRLFHAPIGEMKTPLMQEQASHLFRQKQEAAAKIATETAGDANALEAASRKYAAPDPLSGNMRSRAEEMKSWTSEALNNELKKNPDLNKTVDVLRDAKHGIRDDLKHADAFRNGYINAHDFANANGLPMSPEVGSAFDAHEAAWKHLQDVHSQHAANGAMPFDPMDPNSLRRFVEMKKGGPTAVPEVHALRDKWQQQNAKILIDAKAQGRPAGEYIDDALHYFPRFITEGLQKGPGQAAGKAISTFDPSQLARKEFLHGIPEGADVVRELAQHSELNKLIDSGGTPQEISAFIHNNYGGRIPAMYQSSEMKPVLDAAGKVVGSEPVMKARVPELADWLKDLKPETRQSGVFGNHPLLDLHHRRVNDAMASLATNKVFETLKQPGVLQPASQAARNEGSTTVGELFQKMGLDGSNLPFDPKARVANDVGDDLLRMMKQPALPEPANKIVDFGDSFLNLFKLGNTGLAPSFHVRNRISGEASNVFEGIANPAATQRFNKLMRGEVVPGAANIRAVKELAAERGIPNIDDEIGTKLLGELAHGHNIAPRFEGEIGSVSGRAQNVQGGDLSSILDSLPGVGRKQFSVKKLANLAAGREPGTTLKPWKATYRGVNGKTETTWGPAAAGQLMGNRIEGLNRGGPWLNLIEKGVDPAEAARQVGKVQGNYSSKFHTPFENNVMTRMFPFYKFSRFMVPHTANTLATKPGGLMAQTIKVGNRAQDPDEAAPEYIRNSASIPLNGVPGLSPSDPSVRRYLTGFGLAHEDPLSLASGKPSDMLRELGSRLNPILKSPIEAATQESLFQGGPGGGRDLADMDSTTGRILANLSGRKEAVKYPGASTLDFILGNSPLARGATMVRTATDQRKNVLTKALNLGTGVRISDLSEPARNAVEREQIQEALREAGGKQFLRTYLPKDAKETMTPSEYAAAVALHDRLNALAVAAKRRKELATSNGGK